MPKSRQFTEGSELMGSFGKYRYPIFVCLRISAEGSAEGLRLTFCLSQLRFNTATRAFRTFASFSSTEQSAECFLRVVTENFAAAEVWGHRQTNPGCEIYVEQLFRALHTGRVIWSWIWVGLTLIWMLYPLAELPNHFWENSIRPSHSEWGLSWNTQNLSQPSSLYNQMTHPVKEREKAEFWL